MTALSTHLSKMTRNHKTFRPTSRDWKTGKTDGQWNSTLPNVLLLSVSAPEVVPSVTIISAAKT